MKTSDVAPESREFDEEAFLRDIEDDQDNSLDDEDKDFDTLVRHVSDVAINDIQEDLRDHKKRGDVPSNQAQIQVSPPVVDDFIRNYLIKMDMLNTLNTFEHEWYGMIACGRVRDKYNSVVPDVYLQNQSLEEHIRTLQEELDENKSIAANAKESMCKLRKQRDLHKMHHYQVLQEKEILAVKTKRLEKHMQSVEPLLSEMKSKYESVMKEKTLLRLERDRFAFKLEELGEQVSTSRTEKEAASGKRQTSRKTLKDDKRVRAEAETSQKKTCKKSQNVGAENSCQASLYSNTIADTKIPLHDLSITHSSESFTPPCIGDIKATKSVSGHSNAIAAVAFHPTKPVIATGSDDETWKLWMVPTGELILHGQGHKSWVADVSFHPHGTQLATSSGDNTVKIWDFVNAQCSATLSEHSHPVWESAFHYGGDFLISASMDHTSKLWDLTTQKCRKTFRGHVDSVNSVCFQPCTGNFCTGSGDKTLSLWDIRTGLCVQTFYGHQNAINSVAFTLQGHSIASCDADGCIKVWDVRTIAERGSLNCGRSSLNSIAFDRSDQILASASYDNTVKVLSLKSLESATSESATEELKKDLEGHQGPAQAVAFDPSGHFLLSSSSDCTFCLWSLD